MEKFKTLKTLEKSLNLNITKFKQIWRFYLRPNVYVVGNQRNVIALRKQYFYDITIYIIII